jgi:putative FmdB family regulatory protein
MLYDYECDACKHTFETYQSIHDDALLRCPECDKHKLRRIITGGIYGSVRKGNDEITVGHLADRNRSTFSADKKEMLTEKRDLNKGKLSEPAPTMGDPKVTPKQIQAMTKAQKQHYIVTGETP